MEDAPGAAVAGGEYFRLDLIAPMPEDMEDIPIIQEADVTFVSDTDSPDTIKQKSDVIMLEEGFHIISYALGAAKAIVARIHAVTEYLSVKFTVKEGGRPFSTA